MIGIGAGIGISRMRDLAAAIRALFANSEVGAWYDLSDLSTQFQDAAGTTAVTANGQVEGLWLDKSKGLALGTELATNGGFNADLSGWTVSANWTWVDGRAFLNASSSAETISQAIIPAYSTVEISIDVEVVSGSLQAAFAACVPASFVFSTGTNVIKITNPTSSLRVISVFRATNPTTAYIDNFSSKVISGNHATQATTASKPLSATNSADFDGLDDKMSQTAGGGSTTGFFLCAGLVLDGVGTVQTIWSDTGTNTGYAVRVNASNQLEILAGNGTAYTTCATTDTVSAGTPFVATVLDDGTNLNAQINNGTVVSVARPVVAAGTATATIGSSNAATANVLNGKLFQLIQTKNDAGTDAERAAAKAYVASKIGVTL